MMSIWSTEAYTIPDGKMAIVEEEFNKALVTPWNTPKEFADIFKVFDSDMRMAIPSLTRKSGTREARRIMDMTNLINYLGISPNSVEHASFYKLSRQVFVGATEDMILSYIVEMLNLWIRKTSGISLTKTLAALEPILGQSFKDYWRRFKEIDVCDRYIAMKVKTRKEYEEKSRSLNLDNPLIMGKLIERIAIFDDMIGSVRLIKCLLTDNYKLAATLLEDLYDTDTPNKKLTFYISLAKLYRNS